MCTAGTCGLAMWATRLMPVAKKRGSSSAPGMVLANSGEKRAADARDVDPDLLEHRAGHVAANPAATRFARGVGAVPRREGEGGIGPGLALDVLERGADAVAKAFKPVARGLLLIVEREHGASLRAGGARCKREIGGSRHADCASGSARACDPVVRGTSSCARRSKRMRRRAWRPSPSARSPISSTRSASGRSRRPPRGSNSAGWCRTG